MDVKTGSKSWGYSKRPRNWKKIMHRDLPEEEEVEEIDESRESEARIPEILEEVEEIEEIEEIPGVEEIEEIGRGRESEARIPEEKPPKIEKPKITARVSKPVREELPQPLHDREELPRPLLDPALLDSSFSHI